jgi:zinc transport system substrate-binding protein
MVRTLLKTFTLFVSIAFAFAGHAWAADKLPVFVSILPQKFFVEQIGKDLVDVHVMVEPGASPETYEPKPRQMVALSKARLYFAIGVPFEKAWLQRIAASSPGMRIVHTERGIQKIPMSVGPLIERKDREGEHHDHGVLDPHVWLSPPLVMMQARNILMALQEVDAAHHAVYEAKYKAFIDKVVDLDEELMGIFAGKRGLQFMVFHPAWGYFADAYGLKQIPIEIEGKESTPAELKELIENARKHQIKVVFVQPQFSSKSAEQVAREIGGQVAFVDPLALNWDENLREVAAKFKASLR